MSNEENQKTSNNDNGCFGAGCGCLIAIIVIVLICKFVGWAWGIHWLFGLLLLLFLLGALK